MVRRILLHTEAAAVLREAGKPLHVNEIWNGIAERGLYHTESKTPEATLRTQLLRKTRGVNITAATDEKLFSREKPGVFGLREWEPGRIARPHSVEASNQEVPGGDAVRNDIERATVQAADDVIAEAAARSSGQAFSSSPERRKVVEDWAMRAAMAFLLNKLGYKEEEVENTSKTKPYDLVGTKRRRKLYVEMKGTSAGGDQVFLTKNEVRHAQAHPGECMLFVLYDIKVEEVGGVPIPSGGKHRIVPNRIVPKWLPTDDNNLVALSYQYTLPPDDQSG
jgi:HB1, ASXL, restriction endonuclease HTH domain/Domain of unknown function (DUF3883)